nr:amidohydrolase family protein [Pyrinomonadaceae bacterium]
MITSKRFIRIVRLTSLVALKLIALVSILVSVRVEAQQAQKASAPNGVFAIRNARIVTVAGPEIENGILVIGNGRIEAVGAAVPIPAGAQVVEGRGLTIYPGMIDIGTSLGLVEISAGAPGTVDLSEIGEMNPNAQAIIAVNPHSEHVAVTRVSGVTSVATLPAGGIISGQAALINLNGTTPGEMALVRSAALVVNLPRVIAPSDSFSFSQPQQTPNIPEATAARDRQLDGLRKMLRDAEAYGRAQDAYLQNGSLPRPSSDVRLAALVPFARGERPVILRADREAEVRAAVRFADEMKLRPIILGGNDAWKAAPLLKERDVPVVLTGTLDLPLHEDDNYDTLYENAAKLQRAGVRFCISTGDSGAHVRDLPYHAGMAAAFGLTREEALRAVTLYPAQIMNAADRVGSIAPGKIANLVVT